MPNEQTAIFTVADIEQSERGNESEKNRGESHGSYTTLPAREQSEETSDQTDGDAARLRSELARDLLRRVDAIMSSIGNLSLAAGVQLLKRDLPVLTMCWVIIRARTTSSHL